MSSIDAHTGTVRLKDRVNCGSIKANRTKNQEPRNKENKEVLTGPKNPSNPVLTKSLIGYCSHGAPSSKVG